jgi:sec-independent protein translocase protein TatA
MNTLFAGFFGGWEIVLILAVVLILFGAKKLPELAKGLGQGIKEFKKATNEVTNELSTAMDDHRYTPPHQIENQPPAAPPAQPGQPAQPAEHASQPGPGPGTANKV